jgi:hypothetical protein
MRTTKYAFVLLLSTLILSSCSNDDDNPTPVNEEEIITTVSLTLSDGNGNTVLFKSQDLDGDGPNAPEITTQGNIMASTLYTGSVQFLNELESPAEDITIEVIEEATEHQVFYTLTGNSGSTVTYTDNDSNGNPIGVAITFNSGNVGTGNALTLTLRHEPSKDADGVSDGLIANAGGETDVEVTFSFDVVN